MAFERATFNVELAVTPEQIARGLMGRQHLDDREGMLFIFEAEGLHSFWMKGNGDLSGYSMDRRRQHCDWCDC